MPVQPPGETEQDEAFVDDQVRVDEPPLDMLVGEAEIEAVGAETQPPVGVRDGYRVVPPPLFTVPEVPPKPEALTDQPTFVFVYTPKLAKPELSVVLLVPFPKS